MTKAAHKPLPAHLRAWEGLDRIKTDPRDPSTSKALAAFVARTIDHSDQKFVTVSDGGNLILKIETKLSSARRGKAPRSPQWQIKYGAGKKNVNLGTYPSMDVGAARLAAKKDREALQLLKTGVVVKADGTEVMDPAEARRLFNAALVKKVRDDAAHTAAKKTGTALPGTFGHAYNAFFAHKKTIWKSKSHATQTTSLACKYLGNGDVFTEAQMKGKRAKTVDPVLAPMSLWFRKLKDITKGDLMKIVDHLLKREQPMWETAANVVELAGQVFRYAAGRDWCENNPAAAIQASDTFEDKAEHKHHPKITCPKMLGELVRKLEAEVDAGLVPVCHSSVRARAISAAAVLMQVYVWQRPNNVCAMQWEHIDRVHNLWNIPGEQMKVQNSNWPAHVVPLPKPALILLVKMKKIRPIDPNKSVNYVFTNREGAHLHISTMIGAIERAGMRHTLDNHGLRGTAQTMIHNKLGASYKTLTEAHLHHAPAGALGRTYDEAMYPSERVPMIKAWADLVIKARDYGFEAEEAALLAARKAAGHVSLDDMLAEPVAA